MMQNLKLPLTCFTNIDWLYFQKLMTDLKGEILSVFCIMSSDIFLYINVCCSCRIYGNLNLGSGKQDLPLATISNNVSENLYIRKTVLFYVLCSYTNTLSLIRLPCKLFIVYMEKGL